MQGNQKFFKCSLCGNIASLIDNKGTPMMCCGQKMAVLVPNVAEARTEKHLPAVSIEGDTIVVSVGSVPHPMEDEHYIGFVYVDTEQGGQRKSFKPGAEPRAVFSLSDGDKPIAVYAYCNLHGLWETVV